MCQVFLTFAITLVIIAESRDRRISRTSITRRALKQVNSPSSTDLVNDFFSQSLDHFNADNHELFQQRYAYDKTYWDGTGPVFIMSKDEDEYCDEFLFSDGGSYYSDALAEKFNALVIAIEPRFLSCSIPNNDTSVGNLAFFTFPQVIEDFASITKYLQVELNLSDSNTIIAISGIDDSAFFASWFRQKYPDLVYAAVDSSARVLAITDFFQYNQNVAEAFASSSLGGSETCAKNIASAFEELDRLIDSGKDGFALIEKKFKTCSSIESLDDAVVFLDSISNSLQYYVEECGTFDNYNGEPCLFASVCKLMNVNDLLNASDALDKLAMYANSTNDDDCFDSSYSEKIELLKPNIMEDIESGDREDLYLSCTQIGQFTTCDRNKGKCLFSEKLSLGYYTSFCENLFGISVDDVNKGVENTNSLYGGLNPDVSRVLYVNGQCNPWRSLSITSDQKLPADKDLSTILIPGATEGDDSSSPQPGDSFPVKMARKQIEKKVQEWLDEAPKKMM